MQNDPTIQKPWGHFCPSLANPSGTPPEALQNNRLLICPDSSSPESGARVGKGSFFAWGLFHCRGGIRSSRKQTLRDHQAPRSLGGWGWSQVTVGPGDQLGSWGIAQACNHLGRRRGRIRWDLGVRLAQLERQVPSGHGASEARGQQGAEPGWQQPWGQRLLLPVGTLSTRCQLGAQRAAPPWERDHSGPQPGPCGRGPGA